MSVLLLVRHGQASFGKRDYDVLSERGHEQATILGKALAARGIRPDHVIHGGMRRQADTAAGIIGAAGWSVDPVTDDGWAEFDHEDVIAGHRPAYRHSSLMKADLARTLKPRKAFQTMFVEATGRWSAGKHDDHYRETFGSFCSRIESSLRVAAEGSGTTVVVTSGGVIGVIASRLLTGSTAIWSDLNSVTINTGVTKIISGSSGLTLVSLNEHTHLEHDSSLITYR
ncbi:histidine phosphatase family protein [Luteipulveratus mongoliensis]|uniref:Phosphoglycerate mutase n=1 Tax=Luteipulveratus mongoliensis TaxID=571913 RepID=A0A0K1JKK2_9MICO|nr:histidine phosphatase family protein [Luteipulveratus mongoliensis]AKU17244.1 hypothetical protein VV02_17620 [Luteipulveratus mongoliensis]